MTFDEAVRYLLSLGHETLVIKLGLAATERLLQALGSPQSAYSAVQIAGTNGKGSTAVFLDSICRAAGIRTGLYTSPHLISVTERIRVARREISQADFARLTARVKGTAEQLVAINRLPGLPTFFEHLTAIALLAFQEANVQLAILETGLGGRLDSTTAVRAGMVAITSVAMDHEKYLGETLVQVAAEKAAIIRPGVIAIVAPQMPEARAVILERCRQAGVKPLLVDGDATDAAVGTEPLAVASGLIHAAEIVSTSEDGRFRVSFETAQEVYDEVLVGLRGRHQVNNASVAIALAEALRQSGFTIPRESIVAGIETAEHPGRLEMIDLQPPILLDGAHNPAAARALRDYLDEFVSVPVTMIFGAMRDKNLTLMAEILFPAAGRLILTQFENPRAASLDALSQALPEDLEKSNIIFARSAAEALQKAKQVTPMPGIICVTGSLYLVGSCKEIIKHRDDQAVASAARTT
jgi:dihydrofolate synthase / folylpolyglutamate synthase